MRLLWWGALGGALLSGLALSYTAFYFVLIWPAVFQVAPSRLLALALLTLLVSGQFWMILKGRLPASLLLFGSAALVAAVSTSLK